MKDYKKFRQDFVALTTKHDAMRKEFSNHAMSEFRKAWDAGDEETANTWLIETAGLDWVTYCFMRDYQDNTAKRKAHYDN